MDKHVVLDGRHAHGHVTISRQLQRVLQDDISLRTIVDAFTAVDRGTLDVDSTNGYIMREYIDAKERGDLEDEIFLNVRWSSMHAKRARVLMGLTRVKRGRKKK